MYRRENLHWFNELATISLFLANREFPNVGTGKRVGQNRELPPGG